MNPRKKREFYLFLVDRDKKIFSIEGPMMDDTNWINRVAEIQQSGRDVHFFYENYKGNEIKQKLANSYSKQVGYRYSDRAIFDEPNVVTTKFRGRLPDYAKNANRKRLVKLLCKGKCNRTRWAEMNVDFPGEQALRDPHNVIGKYSAKCLVCGEEALDASHWFG